ncbi:TPA: hypothetical protein SAO52_000172 [Burkholderia vietnamiensis]|nr:hypothetical protein [Burkholderia vietnamiensis]
MKITDDMLLTAKQIAAVMEVVDGHFGIYPPDDSMRERFAKAISQLVGRRTTPDREAIIDKSMVRRLMVQHGLTHDRDTLIEEIAEMVDHMGEGRRLEEYVGAIREMKSGDKGGA